MIIKIPFSSKALKIERVSNDVSSLAKFSSKVKDRNYHKIFVIGFGKTGTTTLEKTLKMFGFTMGNQAVAEILSEDWSQGRSERIISYCHTAEAFQDVPFMMPGLYKELDKAFPKSKFILTVRDNADQWFQSLTKFHAKKFSSDKSRMPTAEDLDNALYCYKGWNLDTAKFFWNYPKVPLYDEAVYKALYENHIQDVNNYFSNRADDMVQINVSNQGDFGKLCKFLQVETKMKNFPWENKT